MAIPVGNIAQITVSGKTYAQVWSNVFTYKVVVWPTTVTAEQAAEGFWNHVKATYRAVFPTGWLEAFTSVSVLDANDSTGDYAVYGIPTGERAGTRTTPSGNAAPPFCAVGVRLNVGSRVTRPGQKRFAGLYESDMDGDTVGGAFTALVESAVAVLADNIVLGSPAATVSLDPCVVKRDPGTGGVAASQLVTSYTVNSLITTQNSRKIGRGI